MSLSIFLTGVSFLPPKARFSVNRACRRLRCFASNADGATAIEYSLLAALIGVALIAGFSLIDPAFTSTAETISETMTVVFGS